MRIENGVLEESQIVFDSKLDSIKKAILVDTAVHIFNTLPVWQNELRCAL
jgi:hypothetical protein